MRDQSRLWIALLAVAALTLGGCSGGQQDEKEGQSAAHSETGHVLTLSAESLEEIGLTTAVAEIKPLAGTMTVPATLIPNQDFEAHVGSLVQGRVREVFVRVGEYVKEGQELMHIEGVEVGEIKSQFITARAQLRYTEANFERQKTLLEQKVGSQKAFLEAQSEYDKAVAEFNAEDKRIHSIGLTDEDLTKFVEHGSKDQENHSGGVLPIKSPISGVVVERNVVIGQLVEGSTTAFRVMNTSTLWADGQIYEKDVPRISERPEITLTVTAYPDEEFPGRVIYISPLVDERTRTITVRASIPNRGGRLKPQMFGELHVPVGGTTRALIIPAEAVQRENEQTYVFVVTTDTTFERRDITLGVAVDSIVEVTGGITPGDRVVTRGTFQLKSELMKESLGEGH